MIRIIIADDHLLFRQSLRTIVEKQGDMVVVAEAGNGIEAIKQAKIHQPDIILMDVEMPVMNGIDATLQIHEAFGGIKIIALSTHAEQIYIDRMMKAGASDYLSKICSREDLIDCIHLVWESPGYHAESLS
jgi:DNA-binding NarL/FixJ family response regulator